MNGRSPFTAIYWEWVIFFNAPPGLGYFDCDVVRRLLDAAVEPRLKNHSSIIYYKVIDLQAACDILTTRGVELEEKQNWGAKFPAHKFRMAFFRDPDSNLLALISEVR